MQRVQQGDALLSHVDEVVSLLSRRTLPEVQTLSRAIALLRAACLRHVEARKRGAVEPELEEQLCR